MQDIDKFKQHVKTQLQEYYDGGKKYRLETSLMTYLIKKYNVSQFIDFGPWAGIMAKLILEQNSQLTKYTGIDAVPLYLEISKEFVTDPRYWTMPALIYNKSTESYTKDNGETEFFTNFYDSLDSSSIFTNRTTSTQKINTLIKVPASPRYHARQFLEDTNFPEFFVEDSYVKMDLDGIDATFVDCYLEKMLKTGIYPKVIQFELWESCLQYWPDIKQKFTKCGYSVPSDIDLKSGLATIAIARGDWWYSQDCHHTIQPKSTIFKQSWK